MKVFLRRSFFSSLFEILTNIHVILTLGVMTFGIYGCSDEQTNPNSMLVMLNNGEGGVETVSSGLQINTPTHGQIFTTKEITVSGTHSTAGMIKVNGADVLVMNQQFSTTLTLEEGGQVIEVTYGNERQTVDVMIDLSPPQIQITSPMYGEHIDSSRNSVVTIIGSVSDAQSGVAQVLINEERVNIENNGRFEYNYLPKNGLNRVQAIVVDRADHSNQMTRGFLFGRFKDWNLPLNEAAQIFVSPFALDTLERAIISAVDSGLIDQLVLSQLENTENISVEEIRYDRVEVNLEPKDGYLDVLVNFYDLRVFFVLESPATRGDVYISPATLSAKLYLTALPDGRLDINIQESNIILDEVFDLRVDNALIGALTTAVEGVIARTAEDVLTGVLEGFLVDGLIDPSLFNPTLNFFNYEVNLHILVEEVLIETRGILLQVGFGMDISSVINDTKGYLYDAQMGAPPALPNMISADLQLNLFHLLLSKLWRSGLMNINLSDLLEEPPAALRAPFMSTFTDGALLEHMSSSEQVGLSMRPQLPPIVRFDPARPDLLIIDLTDLLLDLTLPDGRPWVTLGFSLELIARPSIINNQIDLDVSLSAEAWSVDTPLFQVDTDRLIAVLVPLLEGIPDLQGDDGVNDLFNLSDLNLFGVILETTQIKTSSAPTAYVQVGLQVSAP